MNRTFTRSILFFSFLLSAAVSLTAKGTAEQKDSPLIVYCYDSFCSEWGPGSAIAEEFTKATGIRVEYRTPGDAVTLLNQLILEGSNTDADVVIGPDNSLLHRVIQADILEVYDSPALADVPEELIFDKSHRLLPFDYGHFAICYDSQALKNPPASLEDLTASEFSDSLVLIDPRTSTPGLGFLLWTVAVYQDNWPDYWERLKPSILTISEGWSQAYALFTAGEVPLVISYGTSPVVHVLWDNTDRFKAAEFSDGHIIQIEGMGIVQGTNRREDAEAFIDFMLEDVSQEALAMSNIMLPVKTAVELPDAFSAALRPQKTLELPPEILDSEQTEKIIDRWIEVFAKQ